MERSGREGRSFSLVFARSGGFTIPMNRIFFFKRPGECDEALGRMKASAAAMTTKRRGVLCWSPWRFLLVVGALSLAPQNEDPDG